MAVEGENSVVGEVEAKPEKLKHSIKPTVLDSFTQLANNSEQTRLSGGIKLLGYLLTNDDSEEAEKELKYALTRLIRGIASNKSSARQGYFTTLTVYLTNRVDVSITSLLEILNKELQIAGVSKGETGETCTGHVLACGAALRSGLFLRGSPEEQTALLTALFTAAAKKTYLGLAAYSFIVDFINTAEEQQVRDALWPYLQENLGKPLQEHTLDSLYCLLVLSGRYPSITKKVIKKKLGFPKLLCEETVTIISDKLMNAPEYASVNHPIYEAFGKEIATSEHLVAFWKNGLETKMSIRNQNRVIIALKILDAVLKNITDNSSDIPELLSDRFIPCILEWFRGFKSASLGKKFKARHRYAEDGMEGREVILKAKDVLESLAVALKKENVTTETKVQTLNKLLFQPGDIMFCEITNSKVIRLLIEDLNLEGVKELASSLKKVVANESKKVSVHSSERPWTNTERLRAAEMLTQLITLKASEANIKWRIKNMQFLLHISLFKSTGHEESASVSSELAAAVKKCFFRCLNFRLPKLETLLRVLTSLVDYIDENISNEDNLKKLTKPFAPKTLESWKSMREFTKQLVESSDNSKANTVFQILSLHSGLFLFSDVMSEEMAQNSLQEVQSCYEHYVKDHKSGKDIKITNAIIEGEIVEEEPEWIEVLVDVFLNFLSRDSVLLRNVVQCVFRLLCEYLTPSAIGQIVSVLDPDSDVNPLSYRGDQSSDDDDSDSDADDANDESFKQKADLSNDDESAEEDLSSDNDEDEDNLTVNDQLRMAVQKALGSAAPETDTESIDADNIGEEEGKQLDQALANAFKMLKKSKGKKSKKDKKNDKLLMDFRIRVLDLVDLYLEKEPSMELCLGMLSPLSRCLEFSMKESEQKQLEVKVRRCLKCLTGVRSFSSTDGVTMEILAEYLKAVTSRGDRTQFVFQALGDVISKCSTFIVRCSQRIKSAETPGKKKKKHRNDEAPVIEIYTEALVTFFTKRDCLLPVILFHDVLQLNWVGNWKLLPVILDHAFDSNVRQFRKNEALEMVNIFYKNLKRSLQTETAEDISNKLAPIEEKLSDCILESFKGDTEVNERFFSVLMKLLLTIKSYHTSVKGSNDNMPWDTLQPVVQSCRQCLKLKNTQDYFKFCNVSGLEKIKNKVQPQQVKKESKDSGHDSSLDSDSELETETKSKKNKMNGHAENGKEKVKSKEKKPAKRKAKEISKKDAKKLRIEASSEGLEHVSFSNLLSSNIDVDMIGEHEDEDDEKKEKSKKNKSLEEPSVKKKSKKDKN